MRSPLPPVLVAAAAAASSLLPPRGSAVDAFAPVPPPARAFLVEGRGAPTPEAARKTAIGLSASASPGGDGDDATDKSVGVRGDAPKTAPTFNGNMIFPMRALEAGLRGHRVAAVYAVMNSDYKRGSGDGWGNCEYVGVTRDLASSVRSHVTKRGPKTAAHAKALSFSFPQRAAMEEVAARWRSEAASAGGRAADVGSEWEADVKEVEADDTSGADAEKRALLQELESSYFDDDDDEDFDDDDDEYDDDFDYDLSGKAAAAADDDAASEAVISPFAGGTEDDGSSAVVSPFAEGAAPKIDGGDEPLAFSRENVDGILDEVRPYLISDGGNVAVESVDVETGNVYLLLEGACGSCASSTVTMQMGIERVLRENFPDLGEVVQVEDAAAAGAAPTELTVEAVEAELGRIRPAIAAMGGVVDVVSVDPLGVVEMRYRGSNKLRQGLELAIRDVPFVKHVRFVS